MRKAVFLTGLLLLVAPQCAWSADGKLDEAKKEVREEDDDISTLEFLEGLYLFAKIVLAPYVLAHAYLDESPAWFVDYPYSNGNLGNMIAAKTKPAGCRNESFQVRLEHGWEHERVRRYTGRVLAEWANGVGTSMTGSWLSERSTDGQRDNLSFVEPHVQLRYVQGTGVQLRIGGGPIVMFDSEQTDVGYSFSNEAEIFPGSQLIISPGISAGRIHGTGIVQWRIAVGYIIERWEVYAGYDDRRIGSVSFRSLSSGVRVWF